MKSRWFVLVGSVALGLAVASCGGSDESVIDAPKGGSGGSGGSAGTGGTAAMGGSGGTAGTGGTAGIGGSGGSGGTAGTGGVGGATGGSAGVAGTGGGAGQAGTGGGAGQAGTGGGAGQAGTGGGAGQAGTGGGAGQAGSAGAAGQAGTGGGAGQAGTGGGAGQGGTGGFAGQAGSAGFAGQAGAGGIAGQGGTGGFAGQAGAAGADAGTPCTTPAECDDGLFCNGVEGCENDVCVAGTPPDCADSIPCTTDFCSLSTDACVNVPQDSACSDGAYCNGVETCNAATGCQAGYPPACDDGLTCTDDSCDEINDTCAFVPDDAKCDDNSVCTGAETCVVAVGCVAGTPLDCDDTIVCTVDSCDPALGCEHAANDTACDDGAFCNGAEICDLTNGCSAGTTPCASDNVDCTIDCNEGTDTCGHTPDHTLCAGQVCSLTLGCVNGTSCTSDANCDDGLACNGAETCVGSVCQAGAAIDCNDGIGCTTDSCDDTNGLCINAPNDANCSDGDFCTGSEFCDATLDCQPGTPPDCDDTIACTTDFCSTTQGACVHSPDHSVCDNGLFCDGYETCTATGCVNGTPVVCPDDGFACTQEACDEALNGCVANPDSSLCTDPNFDCVPGEGCVNTCVIADCQGKIYECGDCIDNDGDILADAKDPHCLGACDNTELNFYGGIPGQNAAPCKQDCYFDQDTGSGNDNCYWSHECDPLSVAPDYPPEGSKCEYKETTNLPGYGGTCVDAFATQSQTCLDFCVPLTPNGCDCFGCCDIPGAPTPVWLGSEGSTFCDLDHLDDPSICKPCTVVPSCWNECGNCEICVGKPTLPPECTVQQCPVGLQACGLPGQDPCADGFYCITGCCQPLID